MQATSGLSVGFDLAAVKRRSVTGGAAIFVAQGLRLAIRFLGRLAVARLLTPADFGLIAMVTPALALVQLVTDLGIGQAVVQRQDIKQEEVSSLFWLSLAINVGLSITVVLLSPGLAWLYNEPRLVAISIAFAVMMPISGLSALPSALLSRNLQFGVLALIDIAPPTLGLALAFSAAWVGWGYWSLIAGTAGEAVLGAALTWAASKWRPSFNAFSRSAWSLVAMGGHITLFNFTQYLIVTLDNILIAITRGPIALGLYDNGYKIVTQPISQLLVPTNRIAVPLLTRFLQEPDRYQGAYLGMLQVLFLIACPSILYVMLMAKPLMLLLLGAKWDGIAPIVSWLSFGSFASPLYSSTFWLFVTQGRAKQQLRFGVFGSLISAVGFIAGLPWGPAGVAAGAGLSFVFFITPLLCWAATKEGPVTAKSIVVTVMPFIGATLMTAILLLSIADFVPIEGLGMLAVAAICTFLGFWGSLICIPEGRRTVRRVWRLRLVFAPT